MYLRFCPHTHAALDHHIAGRMMINKAQTSQDPPQDNCGGRAASRRGREAESVGGWATSERYPASPKPVPSAGRARHPEVRRGLHRQQIITRPRRLLFAGSNYSPRENCEIGFTGSPIVSRRHHPNAIHSTNPITPSIWRILLPYDRANSDTAGLS